eukprot:7391679-Prymnesium_polylepis.2
MAAFAAATSAAAASIAASAALSNSALCAATTAAKSLAFVSAFISSRLRRTSGGKAASSLWRCLCITTSICACFHAPHRSSSRIASRISCTLSHHQKLAEISSRHSPSSKCSIRAATLHVEARSAASLAAVASAAATAAAPLAASSALSASVST